MRQFFAIFIDSLYEAVDHKSLLFLLGLSGLLIFFCAGISFNHDKPETVLEQQCATLGLFSKGSGFMSYLVSPTEVKTRDIKTVETSEGWDAGLSGGYAVTLAFRNDDDLDKLVQRWRTAKESADSRGGRPQQVADLFTSPVSPAERLEFFNLRFKRMGYGYVQARLLTADPPTYRVAIKTDYPFELNGAARMRILYGAIDVPLMHASVAETIVRMQLLLANTIAGFIGVLVAIMVCSGFVPSMLQKGTLDLALARPIGRVRLLLYKYLGGLWFVFILSTCLISGCWLVMTLRTGYANPWFLATILTITASFAVIYTVSVLAGVITRSSTVAALCAIFVWGTSSTLIAIRDGMKLLYFGQMAPEWLRTTLDILYDLAPKTSDLNTLNTYFLSRSHLSQAAYQRAFAQRMPHVDWAWSLGTTAVFGMVMLALAGWYFRRRDY